MQRSDFPLAQYQHRALDYLAANDKARLWIIMGGRKTQTTIVHSEITPEINRTLIVCLKDNVKTWADEMNKWLPNPDYMMVRGDQKRKRKIIDEYIDSNTKYLIAGYDSLKAPASYDGKDIRKNIRGKVIKNKKLTKFLQNNAHLFDLIIFDESSEIGNHKSSRWKDIYKIARDIKRRIVMDGDCVADGYEKLFAQYKMSDDGQVFGHSYWDFQEEYWEDEGKPFPSHRLKPGATDRLNLMMQETAFVFTEKDLAREVGMPKVTRKVLYPEMNAIQEMHYKRLKKDFYTVIEDIEVDVSYVIDQIHKMRNVFGGFLKTSEGIKYLKSSKELVISRLLKKHRKSQIVIWCAYRPEIGILIAMCEKRGLRVAGYHGGLSDTERDLVKSSFEDGKLDVVVALGSMGIGLNEFVVANVAIYYSNTDSRRHRAQSEKRIVRPTQLAPMTFIYDIIYTDTPDEKIYHRLLEKKSKSDKLLNYRDLSFLRSI